MSTKQHNPIWLKRSLLTANKIIKKQKDFQSKTDNELKNISAMLKERVQNGEKLNTVLVEAFALVREASKRVTGLEHYPVQIVGGIALHEGKIAELKTGEGKTLVSTMPVYLNALEGKGVHIVTVNDYLAGRDAELMGKIHEFLGLTVGVVLSGTSKEEKQKAYACDITYVTNTELGFDYLRDNMAKNSGEVVQRGLHYAVIDEVDSILIDEARTPLIISGEGEDASKLYLACDQVAKGLKKGTISREFNKMEAIVGETPEETGDYIVHEKEKTVTLTAAGVEKVERYFGLQQYSDRRNLNIQHGMDLALRANNIMKKDIDYVVRNGKVLIVDVSTGRIMEGRQYSDGLHQAIEAKEGVEIQRETQTIAMTTYQNFFNKYEKFSGMTGTGYSEKKEFKNTYHLDTVVIPTNKPVIRIDHPDVVYLTKEGKYKGIIQEILKSIRKGQPVLVGTTSVETSEELSYLLKKEWISHQLLNAKQDAHEAEIIAKAGIHGTVTIATNMAGRGTDIILDEEAKQAGGLKVIGSERHEAIRIDDQLRGRSGRQGDPGESVFYLSTEDNMLRLHGADRIRKMLQAGGYSDEEPLQDKTFAAAVLKAQKKVEDINFASRKNVLEYDRINDKQREMVYQERRKILSGEDVQDEILQCIDHYCRDLVEAYTKKKNIDYQRILKEFRKTVNSDLTIEHLENLKKKELIRFLRENTLCRYRKMENEYIREWERFALLQSIDAAWKEQLRALEFLKQNIWYLGYGQVDVKSCYAEEAFKLFALMQENIYRMTVYAIFHYIIVKNGEDKLNMEKEEAEE